MRTVRADSLQLRAAEQRWRQYLFPGRLNFILINRTTKQAVRNCVCVCVCVCVLAMHVLAVSGGGEGRNCETQFLQTCALYFQLADFLVFLTNTGCRVPVPSLPLTEHRSALLHHIFLTALRQKLKLLERTYKNTPFRSCDDSVHM
jgi:hypothetical protein